MDADLAAAREEAERERKPWSCDRRLWTERGLRYGIEPGRYSLPGSSVVYTLSGFFGSFSGPGFAMTGWPDRWQDMVPALAESEQP